MGEARSGQRCGCCAVGVCISPGLDGVCESVLACCCGGEQLGGRSCYDSLLLVSALRLLDYRPFLVPGAFLTLAPPAQQQQEAEECGCAVRDASGPVKLYLRRLARQQSLHHAVAISTRSWQDQAQGQGSSSSTARHK